MHNRCYYCAHADFSTPSKNQMGGFCHCAKDRPTCHYKPSCHVCDTGKFSPAADAVMRKRRRYFESVGRDMSELER